MKALSPGSPQPPASAVAGDPRELLEAAALRSLTLPYKIWGFGEGPALLGLLETGDLLHNRAFIDYVADLVYPTLHPGAEPTDHLIPLEVLVVLQRACPGLDITSAIARFTTAILNAPRPVAGQPPVHRPDLAHLNTMVWVDCMHTDGPGLALAGHPHEAVRLLDEVAALLQDGSGLFSHGLNVATGSTNQVHWGRGQGWALHGLATTITLGPAPAEPLRLRLHGLLTALAAHEEHGRWHTVTDDPASPFENSISAMVGATVLRGLRDRAIAPSWQAMGLRALAAACAQTGSDGGLPVSEATPVGDHASYLRRDVGVFAWGQGPLMLALAETVRHSKEP